MPLRSQDMTVPSMRVVRKKAIEKFGPKHAPQIHVSVHLLEASAYTKPFKFSFDLLDLPDNSRLSHMRKRTF